MQNRSSLQVNATINFDTPNYVVVGQLLLLLLMMEVIQRGVMYKNSSDVQILFWHTKHI